MNNGKAPAFFSKNQSLRIPRMPMEWLGSGPWTLPSGKALSEFALQSGFLAPLMFGSSVSGSQSLSKDSTKRRPGPVALKGNR